MRRRIHADRLDETGRVVHARIERLHAAQLGGEPALLDRAAQARESRVELVRTALARSGRDVQFVEREQHRVRLRQRPQFVAFERRVEDIVEFS